MTALVECASPHVGQGHDLDDVVLHVALDLLGLHHVVEGVEERPQVRIDLGDDVAGQEAEAFAGLDGWADQDDFLDLSLPQQADGHAHGEPGLAGAGRADAKSQVVLAHGTDVARLAIGARPDVAAAHLADLLRSRTDPFPALADDFEHGAHVFLRQTALLAQHGPQLPEDTLDQGQLLVGALDQDLIAATDQLHAKRRADLAQVLIADCRTAGPLLRDYQG